EVLARWRQPNGAILGPGDFIAEAEATGDIVDITKNLLLRIRKDLGSLYKDNRDLKLSVNLVGDHFASTDIVRDIQEIFCDQRNGIRFQQIQFEITERLPLKSIARARIIVKKLQQLGCRILLDDAGTGHGSLTYLQELGLDVIKIDKSFIDTITETDTASPIVETLIDLSKRMAMETIAEGVDRPCQLRYLRKRGVTAVQGYLLSKPIAGGEYRILVANTKAKLHPALVPFVHTSTPRHASPSAAAA
ncbi:MAG: EAL domain-containing protein, partial [Okeania sp. SIO3H1]|nr:EAL domain-containing protein [Okeania sp. SIO3H1]